MKRAQLKTMEKLSENIREGLEQIWEMLPTSASRDRLMNGHAAAEVWLDDFDRWLNEQETGDGRTSEG